MTRLTIDLPKSLHKTLKSLSVVDGNTMRNIAISALERYAQVRIQGDVKSENNLSLEESTQILQPFLDNYIKKIENKEITDEECSDTFEKIGGYLTDEAENKLLTPKIKEAITQVNLKDNPTWEDLKQKLEKDNT